MLYLIVFQVLSRITSMKGKGPWDNSTFDENRKEPWTKSTGMLGLCVVSTGGRKVTWVREWTMWRYLCDYFPAKVRPRLTFFSINFPTILHSNVGLVGKAV